MRRTKVDMNRLKKSYARTKQKEDFCKIMREFPGKGYESY